MCTSKYIAPTPRDQHPFSTGFSYPLGMSLTTFALSLEHRAQRALQRLADRKSPQPPHLITGERGEDAAFFHLRRLSYTVVARRWRSERLPGDLDLVAWDGATLVIFEIKTRTARDLASAESAVDPHKQRTLRRLAAAYRNRIPRANRARVALRFDVLSVYLLPTGTEFEHFRSAF